MRTSLIAPEARASIFFALALAGIFACSSSPPASPADAGAATDGGTQVGDAGAEGGDAACAAEGATIQQGLDTERARQKLQHAVIGLETPRCGKRVFLSHDPAAAATVTEASLWRIGSITKTFVSAVILDLAANGKLGLDDTLDKFVPTFPNAAGITVRQLMNHTSGIFNYTTGKEFADALAADPKRKYTGAELLAFATPHPPSFEPGKSWEYSNTNYVLLGLIAEKVGGAPIASLVRAGALQKAGLTHTFFAGAEPVTGELTPGFLGKQDVTNLYDPSVAWAAGAIASTPGDLLDWVHALYASERVLTAASQAELRTLVPKAGYGLGVQQIPPPNTLGNGAGWGHGGSIAGFQSQAFWFEGSNVGLVTIVDDTKGDPNALSIVALQSLSE